MRQLTAVLLLAAASLARAEERAATEKELVTDEGEVVRLSLPTEEDAEAWRKPGLHVALGFGGGMLWGRGPAPDLSLAGLSVRALARLDRTWSLGIDLDYASASGGELGGLRFGGLVEALFHPWRGLGVGAGLGYGGLSLSRPGPPSTSGGAIPVSRTLSDGEKLNDCAGDAALGRMRAEYLFVVGPLFATGPFVQADAQLTRCESIVSELDPETGRPVIARQWWLGRGLAAGWWLSWR